jgi:hypothetical protein
MMMAMTPSLNAVSRSLPMVCQPNLFRAKKVAAHLCGERVYGNQFKI